MTWFLLLANLNFITRGELVIAMCQFQCNYDSSQQSLGLYDHKLVQLSKDDTLYYWKNFHLEWENLVLNQVFYADVNCKP